MNPHRSSPYLRLSQLVLSIGLLLTPAAALAQSGNIRTAVVAFANAGPGTANGYENAQARVQYSLLNCPGGELTIAVRRERGSVVHNGRYWVDGQQVNATEAPPESPLVPFKGRVLHGGVIIGSFSIQAGDSLGMECFTGDTQSFAKLRDHLGPTAQPEDIRAFLSRLHIEVDQASVQLRNGAIETRVRNEVARAAREARERQAQMERETREREAREREAQAQRELAERRAAQTAEREREAQARANRPSAGNSSDRDTGFSGSTSASNSTNTTPRDNRPELARSTDGGYFRRGNDGEYRPIPMDEYYGAMEQQRAARQAEAEAVRRREADEAVARFQADHQRRNEQMQRTQAIADRQAEGFARSYYARQIAGDARSNISNITQMRSNYASADELERDFQNRLSALREEMRQLEVAQREQVRASTEIYFADSDPAVGELMNSVGNLIAQQQRQKEEREARERLETQRQRQLREMEAKRHAMVVEMRRNLLAQFPDGGIPFSSDRVELPILYFFSYTFDPATIEQASPRITVSNVFPVHRRGDGTWPLKRVVNEEIRALVPGQNTLIGYYATRQLADSMRTSFLRLGRESGFQPVDFNYGGKVPQGDRPGSLAWRTELWEAVPTSAAKPTSSLNNNLPF